MTTNETPNFLDLLLAIEEEPAEEIDFVAELIEASRREEERAASARAQAEDEARVIARARARMLAEQDARRARFSR